jgi:hypothetical protein
LEIPTVKGAEMPRAIVITEDFTVINTTTTLRDLQAGVGGGLVQPIDLSEEVTMWVNEEGLFRSDLKLNILATRMFSQFHETYTPIMGPVVFTGGTDDEGDTLGLGGGYAESLRELAKFMKAEAGQLEESLVS